jgi:hypothetical protein
VSQYIADAVAEFCQKPGSFELPPNAEIANVLNNTLSGDFESTSPQPADAEAPDEPAIFLCELGVGILPYGFG